eukprot:gene20063-26049_t
MPVITRPTNGPDVNERTHLMIQIKHNEINNNKTPVGGKYRQYFSIVAVLSSIIIFVIAINPWKTKQSIPLNDAPLPPHDPILQTMEPLALSTPLSIKSPVDLKFNSVERPYDSKPGDILSQVKDEYSTLPTNTWCENLMLGHGNADENRVFQIPYVVDAAEVIPGIRTHPSRLLASPHEVQMAYEPENAITLSAVEPLNNQYRVAGMGQSTIGRLFLGLEWFPDNARYSEDQEYEYKIQAHIARGSPYISTMYFNATPRLLVHRSLIDLPIIDGLTNQTKLTCSNVSGEFTNPPVLVNRHIQLRFHASDMTWMVFFSEPTEVQCSSTLKETLDTNPPYFELRATNKYSKGMVRIAMANNCTSGLNPRYCEDGKRRDNSAYLNMLIRHADLYPTAKADIELDYPDVAETKLLNGVEKFHIRFNWNAAAMSSIRNEMLGIPQIELLMLGLPHHQEILHATVGSTNQVITNIGCSPTLHGMACPVFGNSWYLKETLHPVTFGTDKAPNPAFLPDILKAISDDIHYTIPDNYRYGAGDTYFSGKMLTKLARIIVIADKVRSEHPNVISDSAFKDAVTRLREGTEIWLNGSAVSPFTYDSTWGGVLSCGCDYNYANGYHIYAAAVVSKFDNAWAKANIERVLLLIRDIANPSQDDPYFTSYRNQDWYTGIAWASGIVMLGGQPYLNGRNLESSSEAIAAYEAIGLYGDVISQIYDFNSIETEVRRRHEVGRRIKTVGRALMSTMLRTAQTYYHVQTRGNNGSVRIYPDIYAGKSVGMLWSMMMEQQTWFGSEAWKSYGIQLLPLTPVSHIRDSVNWVREMLPILSESCSINPDCEKYGWSILVLHSMAVIGKSNEAVQGINALSDDVFVSAGGNAHIKAVRSFYEDKIITIDGSKDKNDISDDVIHSLARVLTKRHIKKAPKLIIAGAPASGKGTHSEIIKKTFGVIHLSTGDILREAVKEGTELGLKAKGYMDAGQLVPDDLIISAVCDRLRQKDCLEHGWLLDGFPRTGAQARALSDQGLTPDSFVLLHVPEELLVERVTGRRSDPVTGKIYHIKFSPPENDEISSRLIQRSDDTEEKVKIRFKEYLSHVDAVKSLYEDKIINIDGTVEKSVIWDNIINSLTAALSI